MNAQNSDQELQKKIYEIYLLLEETFSSKDTKKIKDARNKLNEIFKDLKNSVDLLFIALSYKTIGGKEIPLDIHKSVAIYLKNILCVQKIFKSDEVYNYILKIFDLIFNKSNENPNLKNIAINNSFQTMVTNLLSSKAVLEEKNDYIIKLFEIVSDSIKNVKTENFLDVAKSVILLISSLFSSKSANNENYELLVTKYYMPIIDIIFANVPKFLIPQDNIYNIEFLTILKLLFDGFYSNLTRMRGILPIEKRKEISMKLFKEYGTYCFELLHLSPAFDEATTQQFVKPNPIIVFGSNQKLCYEMNHMKSKAIQFLSFITQISTVEEKFMDEDSKNSINDKELKELLIKLIYSIVNTFEDILNNENKFNFLRKYTGEFNDEDDCYNMVLFQICVFLTRSLIREPIKTQFSGHMKQFLLNMLFPMIVTIDDEQNFAETDPEGYHQYINDITSMFKIKNFRTSGCFLIKKICEKFEDMSNFVLSFCIEMMNYIITGGQINTQVSDYNIYLKNKKDALIDQFNDKKKLDFALLIILILRDKIRNEKFFKSRLVEIIINNYENIHRITFSLIKIKLCKVYYYFIPGFFEGNETIQKENKKNFIENVVNFLLNNIIQKNLQTGEEYSQALSFGASEAIIELSNLPKDESNEENTLLRELITKSLEQNFHILNQLISNVDIYTFYMIIDQIISTIQISQRNLVFECINNLSKKFLQQFLNQNGQKEENNLYLSQYFTIIISFLNGKNKITPGNKEEISKFNECFNQILNYIKNPKKFGFYEQLVTTTEDYIKSLDGINEQSALVLKNIKAIIDKDSTLSTHCYNFVSTFLSYIQKNISEKPLNQEELFMDILEIIKKGFSLKTETLKTSKIFALLLTLQILSLNPNLNSEVFEYLILQSLESFELVHIKEDIISYRDNINQLSLANVSLGFVFKPEQTFQILQQTFTVIKNEGKAEIPRFNKYVSFLKEIFNISYPEYSPILGKCIILGICGIFANQKCAESLKNSMMDIKLFLLSIFINLVSFHKRQKCYILNKLMKKEIRCNFVEENELEDEEEEEDDYNDSDEEFNSNIEQALSNSDNIKNSDEFQFFSKVINDIKNNDKEVYEYIVNKFNDGSKLMEELTKVRNIKIIYDNKEFTVPRKTVKIIKKNH